MDMSMVAGKYMGVRDDDGEGKYTVSVFSEKMFK